MATKPGLYGTAPPTREERVQLCMRLMRRLKWRRGVTDKNIAAHWGMTIDAVQQYSSEAFRRVKGEVTDPDQTAATVCVALERVIREAAEKGMYGHRSVIEAAKTWAQIAGAGAPTRLEIGALASLTEDQLARRRIELVQRLQDEDHIAENEPTAEETAARVKFEAEREATIVAKLTAPETVGGAAADQAALRHEIGDEVGEKDLKRQLRRTLSLEAPAPEDPPDPTRPSFRNHR